MKSARRKPKESRRREMGSRKMRDEVYGMQIRTSARGKWIVHI